MIFPKANVKVHRQLAQWETSCAMKSASTAEHIGAQERCVREPSKGSIFSCQNMKIIQFDLEFNADLLVLLAKVIKIV